jgi:beta-galactosidase
MRWPRGLEGRLGYGGDYNPEQWEPAVRAEDLRLMRRAGVNLATVGVFSWSTVEPREGEYAFGWLDEVLDRLHDHRIRVALATPTASPPPWFTFAYPDALPVTRDGIRLSHGSRDTYCPSAPAYRAAALRIATELGRRYGDHPALALWHVHNEYGTSCHCDHAAAGFRRWLRSRYGDDLDRLNRAWTTAFWGQGYADWDHVLPPRATRYLPNPAQLLDFRRFTSDELLGCFTDQRDALRALSPDVPVNTNFVLGGWVPVDHRRWAREVDLVAIDHYPDDADPLAAEAQTALAADRARGWAGGRPWLLMEQAPDLIYAGGRMHPKEPGRHTRLTLSHVARGAIGALAFQWRASRGGAERFGSAMLPHAGPDGRVFAETVALGARLAALPATEARVVADVGLVDSAESGWVLQGPGLPAPDLDRERVVRSVHSALWRAGITVDVVAATDDLARYPVLFAPALFLLTSAERVGLTSYVEGGGQLVLTYLSAAVDEDGQVDPSFTRRLLGLTVEALRPGPPWSELVRPHGAEVVLDHPDGPLVTRYPCGSGAAWYVTTELPGETLLAIVGLTPRHPAGLEVVRREDGTWYAINHTRVVHTVDGVPVPPGEACFHAGR